MQLRNTPNSYGAVAKLLHWGILALIIAQYVMAEAAEELADGPEKLGVITNHKSVGLLILLLALARIGWKIVNRGQPQPVPMARPQRIAAAAGHGILYLLLLVLPLSGWMMSSAAGYPAGLFGLFEFPALVGENHDLHEALEEVHETLFNAVVVLAVLHALAAVYHHFWMKDDTLRRMLPFARHR
ncbi:MAG: cytochrome b [Steroidobacteraceae bacterium]|nr:cytochrome b [Steroidobacteraceae bacterium]